MPVALKLVIHILLILLCVVIVRFFLTFIKNIKEGLQEGMEEARQEVADELDEEEMLSSLKTQVPLLERIAISLACPFRVTQIDTNLEESSPHLYQIGHLDELGKKTLRESLERDFGLPDEYANQSVTEQMLDLLTGIDESEWGVVLSVSIQMYIITACADLGYVQFYDHIHLVSAYIENLKKSKLQSWKEYADTFLKEEKEAQLNSIKGRALLTYWTGRLLNGTESPWKAMPWERVLQFQDKGATMGQEELPLE